MKEKKRIFAKIYTPAVFPELYRFGPVGVSDNK